MSDAVEAARMLAQDLDDGTIANGHRLREVLAWIALNRSAAACGRGGPITQLEDLLVRMFGELERLGLVTIRTVGLSLRATLTSEGRMVLACRPPRPLPDEKDVLPSDPR